MTTVEGSSARTREADEGRPMQLALFSIHGNLKRSRRVPSSPRRIDRQLKEKSNVCKIYLSSLIVSYRHPATFHSPILGDVLPPGSSILYPENAPEQII